MVKSYLYLSFISIFILTFIEVQYLMFVFSDISGWTLDFRVAADVLAVTHCVVSPPLFKRLPSYVLDNAFFNHFINPSQFHQ